ncbi:DUF2357 domain-containing protein [Cylindrospermopsis raciborskii]|uniref:DUF2357 domain-containing protein n=1 Tax=Cylindrospermopsis raciborskii CENA302 TaxID=1170768 RepID=A0A9Q5W823_9CYAN|nr:DUF2357 domain-containing protein [Cylindrospermopsis raciborskii]NLQ04572.1 DUF2357 domain-containing protein [Cylindrospermopsis raciborskii MVCC19]OHY35669.1 hypothetical protein BCV64_01905 [Cylindrospermopsis raciborskii MVCC14]OPH08981.1 hypothetical protein CENA302_13535 [Cylindrospermopsis raciborskii CENA302]
MRIYPSLFAYLNQHQSPLISDIFALEASHRPILVLELDEDELLSLPSWFIPISQGIYEVGFPYLQPTDLHYDHDHHASLRYVLSLAIPGQGYNLSITDVLDLETIKEEVEIPEWEHRLGNRLDRTASELVRLFIGMFTHISSGTTRINSEANILLSGLSQKLDSVNIEDANLPIVISLDNKYQLHQKLELIGSRLRHQLTRKAELIPVGKIQEMDSYCLRDYIRRPGSTPEEKAGSKQELMGIKRYQDFNTPENKFLVYFARIFHLNCVQYEISNANQFRSQINKIRLVIDLFQQLPTVKTIQNRGYQFTKPNYVLQQNTIYKSFYQAYLEYIRKKHEKENLWGFRNYLLADAIYIYLIVGLLRLQGVNIDPTVGVSCKLIPDQGRYLSPDQNIKVRVFLQTRVCVFGLEKPSNIAMGDWMLTLEIHQLDSMELNSNKLQFPIWVFWYLPSRDVINQMGYYYLHNLRNQELENNGLFAGAIVLYLQDHTQNYSLDDSPSYEELFPNLRLVKLPENFTEQGFSQTVEIIFNTLIEVVGGFTL